ncbi:deoxycytidine deaminase [Xanthomonas phage RiverRider]|uniref:Deoxycytidine deaminase n=1 Tax=Xanthomonas phage RiverRider TaxID=2108116 RepID=A0A2P1JUT6_9CAUD|nr:dCTP deaminase [Xanthomonas phage RiverRider]AVO23121.1 deoxycytidine deaminase [Xanthomonas phage RiverRider]
MIINSHVLLSKAPIKDMFATKQSNGDVSFGMSEAGYDIRIKQAIKFHSGGVRIHCTTGSDWHANKRFCLASAIEEFQMPDDLVGIVHDKSTWARRGLSVFNTVIEPGWHGFLTLELVYHGQEELIIPAGSGIAQVVFHETAVASAYNGKYQNQEDMPVGPRQA